VSLSFEINQIQEICKELLKTTTVCCWVLSWQSVKRSLICKSYVVTLLQRYSNLWYLSTDMSDIAVFVALLLYYNHIAGWYLHSALWVADACMLETHCTCYLTKLFIKSVMSQASKLLLVTLYFSYRALSFHHTFLKPAKCTLLIYYTIQFFTVKSVQHVSVPYFGTIIRAHDCWFVILCNSRYGSLTMVPKIGNRNMLDWFYC
jgi:hypothetical protein